MNRNIGALAITFLLSGVGFAQNCVVTISKLPMQKKQYQRLQRFVSEGHQPWRLDSQAVAGSKALEIDRVSGHSDPYLVDVKLVSKAPRTETYEYKSLRHTSTVYRIVLMRPKWLDQLAKKTQWMIWVPVQVTKTTCK